MNTKEWKRLLDIYSIEDGNCCNTGSRLTMKPLAGPLPRRKKSAVPSPRSRRATAPAV